MKYTVWVLVGLNLLLTLHFSLAAKRDEKSPVKRVHVVFMNHLDVGYSDGTTKGVGYAIDVINRYFTEYFPRAISLPGKLQELGYEETFIYTTHPWLVSLYINCPDISLIGKQLKCPSFKEINQFGNAVKNGTIAWHAGPMNMQTDNMGALMFNYSLNIAESLDKLFGINRTHATYSQRDVPGMTKAVLPYLAAHNIKAISVGVNPGTAPPAVPSPFVWKFGNEEDDEGILAFWGKGGYPRDPGPNPKHPGGLAKDKCVMVEGLEDALCFAFRTDNTGPPKDTQEILSNYEVLRAEFPNATIFASTFDHFVSALETVKKSLPVRRFEIGDTWIQGIASDPYKISMYRAFVRCIETCMSEGNCSFSDPRVFNALRFLIKVPEHTWGAHNFLNSIDWTNSELLSARQSTSFKETELTWHEQRQFVYLAIKALGDHPVVAAIEKDIAQLQTARPDFTDYVPATMNQEFTCEDGKILRFAVDGSLERLYDPINKIEWASPVHPLGQLSYNTFVEADFVDMAQQYNYDAGVGFDKPNVTINAHPEKKLWDMGVISFHRKNDRSCNFWMELKTLDIETDIKYGAPISFFLNYVSIPNQGLNMTVLLLNKTTTRLPESVSLNFNPKRSESANVMNWTMTKMGYDLDPCNVVLNGSQYVHAVDSTVKITNKDNKGLIIAGYDSPLILWGTTDRNPSPFPVPLQPFNCSTLTSVAFNLYNNIWNTNYIYYYPYSSFDSSFKSRFSLYFS